MKKLTIAIISISLVLLASCTTKCPSLKDPEKGIIAIRVEASNTTTEKFFRSYQILSTDSSDIVIKIFPQNGNSFAFSSELIPGRYDLNKIIDPPVATMGAGYMTIERSTETTIFMEPIEVKPGAVTIAKSKLVIEQYRDETYLSGDEAWKTKWLITRVLNSEMPELIEEFKQIDTDKQWKIAN